MIPFKQTTIFILTWFSTILLCYSQMDEELKLQEVIENERKAYFLGDFDSWKGFWDLENSISYLITIDGERFSDGDSLSLFVGNKILKRKPDFTPKVTFSEMLFLVNGDHAYATFVQSLGFTKTGISGFSDESKSFETRSLRKVNGSWKIYAGVSSAFCHETTLPMAELFLGRSTWILFEQGKTIESIEVAKAYTNAFPESLSGWGTLTFLHEQNGNFSEAIEALNRAIQLAPDDTKLKSWHERLIKGSK